MHGFGCKIIAYKTDENQELLHETPKSYKTLDDVFAVSSVLSVHSTSKESSYHLFDKTTFSIFKKGMIFINTAHRKFVNTEDLKDAIDNKIIVAVFLDAYQKGRFYIFLELHIQRFSI